MPGAWFTMKYLPINWETTGGFFSFNETYKSFSLLNKLYSNEHRPNVLKQFREIKSSNQKGKVWFYVLGIDLVNCGFKYLI